MALVNARQVTGDSAANVISVLFSDTTPTPESRVPAPGTMPKASRGDHVHERLTSTASGTLGSAGEATITFTRNFPTKPAVTVLLVEATDGMPVSFKVKSWIITGGLYTGCIIKGQRFTLLPVLQPLTLTALLTGVITGVNSLVSGLTGFNVANGNAVGAEYSFIAIQPS